MQAAQDNQKWDAIVIGSGLGGMAVATFLSMAKKRVLLLERHYVPGGFTHTFKRQGLEWDVGVHYVGQVDKKHAILRKIFDYLTESELKWASMGAVYDQAVIAGQRVDFVSGREEQIQNLVKQFPQEEAGIREYFKAVAKVSASSAWFFSEKTMPPWLSRHVGKYLRQYFERWSGKTTLEVLKTFTTNPRLLATLCVQCGDYGLPPAQSSFGVHAMVVDHYVGGASYPEGGAKSIHESILRVFKKYGGTLRLRTEVKSISIENGRCVGVELADGQKLQASVVVSNAGVRNTFTKLLPKSAVLPEMTQALGEIKPSVAHLCLYVGLKGSDEELGLPKHNIWIYDNEHFTEARDVSAAEKDLTYISFPSAKDPAWAAKHPGTATVQVIRACSFEKVAQWKDAPFGKRGTEYEEQKEIWSQELLLKLYEVCPHLEGKVSFLELSTPLSTDHFMNYSRGEIYGLEHTPARFKLRQLRPRTSIKGLYLTGQDIVTVGVGGALYSGVLAATTILKRSVILRVIFNRKL